MIAADEDYLGEEAVDGDLYDGAEESVVPAEAACPGKGGNGRQKFSRVLPRECDGGRPQPGSSA